MGIILGSSTELNEVPLDPPVIPRSVYPGEAFSISFVAVGQRYGVAPAVIEGTVISSHSHYLLPLHDTSNHCINLNYNTALQEPKGITQLD